MTYGPLVYCLEIPACERVIKALAVDGFYEKGYRPVSRFIETLKIKPENYDRFLYDAQRPVLDWKDLRISGIFSRGEQAQAIMRPMARTILRKVTF